MSPMRNHYLPRKYLKGFTNSTTSKLWVYTKEGKVFPSSTNNTAVEKGYYSDDLEQYLADEVENPANDVLEKIRSHHGISNDEKIEFARYLAAMMKRVPRGKERVKNLMPVVTEDVRKEMIRDIDSLTTRFPQAAQKTNDFKNEANRILDKYLHERPDHIWQDVIPPHQTSQTIDALAQMTWQFLTFDKPAIFTSDNPVFYFEEIGIGKPESELTFPLSSHILLWATWRSDLEEGYFPTTMQAVKESNRRVAHNATKYIYHAREESWILPFLKKGRWQLNHLI